MKTMTKLGIGMAVAAAMVACGGGEKKAAPAESTAAAPAAAPSAAAAPAAGAVAAKPATGKTWEVKMIGDAQGYRFEPKELSIKAGDAVKFIMVSGGPHDVTFWADSIPSGAQAQLQANMPNTTAPLTAPMTINPNDTYTVSFAGVPAGVYKYYCTPHLAMGMVAKITVQ
ncbi:MAG TPA: plastocyanin/azurin family copper-binding protein [Gemmatimonadaceae bacterium]|nr:plastocyanin/azurin family copper-binding protein [Gemmatimonadaceae bacterium]